MELSNLIKEAHETAKKKGWWDEPREIGTQIALMHSELSEALEEARENKPPIYFTASEKPEGIAVEFADVLIRIFDTCAFYGYDLEDALLQKMAYNKTRSHRHGNKAF